MSSFSGLSVGLSSLYAQRAGLELAGHNVANANTEGYTRQRVGMAGDGGPITPAIHSTYKGTGNGVTITELQRLRDGFLEARALQERGTQSQLASGQLVLSRVEGIIGEPSESGIQSQLSDFWNGWSDVANKPTDSAARNQLLERSQTLANGLNTAVDNLQSQRSSFQEQLGATVADVNATAAAVADYNRAIVSATQAGSSPNDLKDQRDLLVQRLGELVGATVKGGENGSVDVFVGGRALVSGRTSETMTTSTPATSVSWTADGAAVDPLGGTARGLLTGITEVLPRYADDLRAVAKQLHDDVNAQHAAGFDPSGTKGGNFFALDASGRLSVAITQPGQIAASSADGGGTGDTGGGNAIKLAELAGRAGGADEAYRGLVVQLGVEAQSANRRVDIQSTILGQIDAARESQSGVNLDEEMTNLLAFQRAYEGAARFVSAVDSMLDTLINRTGLVGR